MTTAAGFFEPKRLSPTSLAIVLALHGAGITALMLARMEPPIPGIVPTKIWNIPLPEPEPIPVPKAKTKEPRLPPRHASTTERTPLAPFPPQNPAAGNPVPQPVDPPWTPPGAEPIDPPPLEQAARATGDVRKLFTPDDYPALARQRQESGSLRARLDIAASGRVAGCSIVESSGSRVLDTAACRVLKTRARFTPAKDSIGQPTGDSYVTPRIVWQLVDG